MEEAVGKCVSNGLANWVSKETEDLRKARHDAKSKHPLLNRAAHRKRLKDLRTILNVFYLTNQAKYLAADEKGETNKAWRTTHSLTGKKRQVKKRDGSHPSSHQDLLDKCKQFFSLAQPSLFKAWAQLHSTDSYSKACYRRLPSKKGTIIGFLKASYCSINRESMFGILHRYGISIVSTISLVRQLLKVTSISRWPYGRRL